MFSFGEVLAEVREFVRQQIMPLIRYRRMTKPSADGWDEATGHPAGPGEPRASDQVRRMQHYGFRSTPPSGAELLTVAVGGAAGQHVAIASELPGAGPQSQPSGDAEMYVADGYELHIRANGAEIKIDKDGGVTVDAAPGQQVVIQGSAAAAQPAARYNDPVAANASMVTWMAAVNTAFAALVPPVTLPTPPGTFGFIANGSTHTKIG